MKVCCVLALFLVSVVLAQENKPKFKQNCINLEKAKASAKDGGDDCQNLGKKDTESKTKEEKVKKFYRCFLKGNDLRDENDATIIDSLTAVIDKIAINEEKRTALKGAVDTCCEDKLLIAAGDRQKFYNCLLAEISQKKICKQHPK